MKNYQIKFSLFGWELNIQLRHGHTRAEDFECTYDAAKTKAAVEELEAKVDLAALNRQARAIRARRNLTQGESHV